MSSKSSSPSSSPPSDLTTSLPSGYYSTPYARSGGSSDGMFPSAIRVNYTTQQGENTKTTTVALAEQNDGSLKGNWSDIDAGNLEVVFYLDDQMDLILESITPLVTTLEYTAIR